MSDTTTTREEGVRLLQAGEVTGALHTLRQAVSQNPTDGKAYGYLGVGYARLGDYSLAVTALQHAVRLLPNDASMRFNLGMTLFQAQRYAEAKPELELALSLNPNHTGARDLLDRIVNLGAAAAASTASPPASPGLGQPHAQPMGAVSASPPPPLSPGGAPAWNPAPTAGMSAAPPMPSWSTAPSSGSGAPAAELSPPGMAPGPAHPVAGIPPAGGAESLSAPSAGGLHYIPADIGAAEGRAPGMGRCLLRGWLWGIVFGQYWTLWQLISGVLFGHVGNPGFWPYLLVFAFVNAFFGSLTGIVIGACKAQERSAAVIGVGAGVIIMLIRAFLTQSPYQLLNIFFYFVTGRIVGAGIAGRVNQPVSE